MTVDFGLTAYNISMGRSLKSIQKSHFLRVLTAEYAELSQPTLVAGSFIPSSLLGYEVVHEAVADRRILNFLKATWLHDVFNVFREYSVTALTLKVKLHSASDKP